MARTTFTGPVKSLNGFEGAFAATSVELESNNGKKITLDAPNSLAADYTFLLPGGTGTNGQVLTTNGSGVTSWTTNGAGTVTSVGGTGSVSGLTLSGTVTSSGSLTLGGSLNLSSPPAIGGTAANSGKFTTLEATGNATLSGAANVIIIPTTDPAVAGAIWNDSGTLKVSAG